MDTKTSPDKMTYNMNDKNDMDQILLIGRALNSPTRLQIINMLNIKPMTLTEIAKVLNIPNSSASMHTQILIDAKIIEIDYSTNKKGHIKYHTYSRYKSVTINLREPFGHGEEIQPFVHEIALGEYIDIKVGYRSGAATSREEIATGGDVFNGMEFSNMRRDMQILFISDGYVTYAIPNHFAKHNDVSRIELKLEICSEASGYNETYPSDISFFLNDKRICVYTAPGDFGARYGKYTPDWWFKESTKYGLPVTIAVTDTGVWLNGELVNKSVTLKDLNMAEGNKMTLRIEVEDDAKHKGGFNLFGEKFGDYDFPIVFTAYFDKVRS